MAISTAEQEPDARLRPKICIHYCTCMMTHSRGRFHVKYYTIARFPLKFWSSRGLPVARLLHSSQNCIEGRRWHPSVKDRGMLISALRCHQRSLGGLHRLQLATPYTFLISCSVTSARSLLLVIGRNHRSSESSALRLWMLGGKSRTIQRPQINLLSL